jgi:sulfur carrier protein ThiS adenylyltransferase
MNPTVLSKRLQQDRDVRQREIVPPDRLRACHGVVIGVGAIGRQVVLQLAGMGVPRLTLFDPDTVGVENLATQGYGPDDLGHPKVAATAATAQWLNPDIEVTALAERFRRTSARRLASHDQLVVFACVDQIGTRRLLWESYRQTAAFFVDGRMSAEVIRVLAVPEPARDGFYGTTLFAAAQAYTGSCTAKATIYTASIAAGLMLGQFTRWLRHMPVDADVSLNVLSMELIVRPSTS